MKMSVNDSTEESTSNNSNLNEDETANSKSVFDERTEEASATQYFQFYGYLSQQQNMLQDYVRTYSYQRAVLSNLADFKDKVVLDVGAGSGILSFFAAQAGARKVYAVEASSMAQYCEILVKHNHLENKITVVPGKIEEITIPELVDTIISEPMGYMLLNERMLETFLHAKKFLKPEVGKMFPTQGDLHIAPFTDESLFLEQCGKANFWYQESFHGVNLSALRQQALKEYFKQPVVDTFHVGILLAPSVKWSINFLDQSESSLHNIEIPLEFVLQQTAFIHGLAFWFDVAFIGTNQTVWLSTAPTEPLTHWYQVRCLLDRPLWGVLGSVASGKVVLVANKRQSYDVDIELTCNGLTARNSLDLKNPCFRYTGQPVQAPPGMQTASPTESYWTQMAAAGQIDNNGQILVNATAPPHMVNGVMGSVGDGYVPTATANIPNVGNVITLLPNGQATMTSSLSQNQPQAAMMPMVNRMPANVVVNAHGQQQQIYGHHPQAALNLTDYLMTGLGSPPPGGPTSPTAQHHGNAGPLISNPLKM